MFSSTPDVVSARKPHRCTWCHHRIEIGEHYWRWFDVNDDAQTIKMHMECRAAMTAEQEAEGGWLEWMPGEGEPPERLRGASTKEPTAEGITDAQRHILVHALTGGLRRVYRNHFVTGPGSEDFDACEALTASGMMTRREGSPLTGGDPIYHVTAAGAAAVGLELPKE